MKNLKRQNHHALMCVLIVVFLSVLLVSCSKQAAYADPIIFGDVDFSSSPYKHITNGGVSADATMPYNIDAITGATVTVEGPGVVTSIPLSVRELENRGDGLVRGSYIDEKGQFIYEGLDLHYLLNDMIEGDNGIILTDKAYRIMLKDANRADVASFTLEDITKAHDNGRPILLAYGIGTLDQAAAAPFVFDAANPDERSEGYIQELDNGDGCLKLVYDLADYGGNADYKHFTNVAYVYVLEENEPGFKHTAGGGAYGSSRYADYIVTFRGEAIGHELNLTVRQLEDLVFYDEAGQLVQGGVGYSDFYSLANNAYWYVNQYEGLDLYKLLLYLGMDDAQTMGTAAARTTLVSFVANDGVASSESFSVDALSYPDTFGFYNKNAVDPGDGSYKPTNADLVDTGYPVLLAYGVNRYPYTIAKGDDGYLSGLSNSGGPFRVVFGKTQYSHPNGSKQVQYLKDVIAGKDMLYNTHKYTDNAAQKALAQNTLSILVRGDGGQMLMEKTLTIGEIEDIVYAEGVAGNVKKAASLKDLYEVDAGGGYATDIYEGVSLQHLLLETLGIPGTNGTITFLGEDGQLKINLDTALRGGFNAELGREGLQPVLAFAKNGSPMVKNQSSGGYIDQLPLHPLIDSEPGAYTVRNTGGPLAVILPSSGPDTADALSLMNLTGIEIELIPDAYAHISPPYADLAQSTIRFYGEGLEKEVSYTVAEIESRQTRIKTLDFSVLNNQGSHTEQRYRGIALYDLFTEIGIKSNAGEVIVHSSDGTSQTYSLSRIKRGSYVNQLDESKKDLFAMLAFGVGKSGGDSMDGLPFVKTELDEGYDADFKNSGGPLRLILPQEAKSEANAALMIKDVAAIEVTANDIDTWNHRMSDIYGEFLDYEFTFTVKNDKSEWTQVFTLDQLESMKDLLVRDSYTVLDIGQCEGLDIWKFVKKIAGSAEGIDHPVSVTVYAEDGYKNDLLSVFYKDGLELGVPNEDGERKALIIAYALNGLPLVDTEGHEGYTGLSGNFGGPLRVVAETVQGASVKYVNKLVVTIPGDGPIDILVDEGMFNQ